MAHGAPAALVAATFARQDGIQREASDGTSQDSRKKKKAMMDHEFAVSKDLVVPSEETCDSCHKSGSVD